MKKSKFLNTPLILLLVMVFAIPLTLIGCGKGDGNVETPNSKDAKYTRYVECVEILKTAINNISNNANDTLNGFGIYNTYSVYIDDGEPVETYFESVKGEDEDSSNYYASYYVGTEDGELNKHYTLYSSENDYNGTKTYVMKEDYEECVLGEHAEARRQSLTEIATIYLSMTHNYKFTEDAVVGWYESFEDEEDFSMTCKYTKDGQEYTIIEYTVEDGKLVSIDAKTYGSLNSLSVHEQVEIKYGIEVDAYDKYNYAKLHLAGLA